MRRSGAQLFLACVGLLQACGTAAPYGYNVPEEGEQEQGPLLTLTGVVQEKAPQSVDLSQTRAALIWFPMVAGTVNQVPQDVGKPKTTDSRVEIDVYKAPSLPDTIRDQFQAELVFYIDDGNEAFDVRPKGEVSRDRVVGRAPSSRIGWQNDDQKGPTAGSKSKDNRQFCLREWPDFTRTCLSPEKEDTALKPIPIIVVDEDVLRSYTCKGFWGSADQPDNAPGISPSIRKQICTGCSDVAGGKSNNCQREPLNGGWRACAKDEALCGTRFCHESKVAFVEGRSDCE